MRKSRTFLCALVLSLVLSSLSCWAEGGITLSDSEFQMLRETLRTADEQLQKSESEMATLRIQLTESQSLSENLQIQCEGLVSQLRTQDEALVTLENQLDEALKSLTKLKREASWNNVIFVIVGVAGFALGSSLALLFIGGR